MHATMRRWLTAPIAVVGVALITLLGFTPAHAASASLTADAETGDLSVWGTTASASATALSRYHGAYGYHLSAATTASYLNWTSTQVEQNHEWASVSMWVKVDSKAASPQTTDLISIKNNNGVNHFDLFWNGANKFQWDLLSTDTDQVATANSFNTWHLVEARVYFGASTYTAQVAIDGVDQGTISSVSQVPTYVKTAWIGTSTTTKTYEFDADDIKLDVSETDPGYNGSVTTSPFGATGCV